MKIRIAHNEHKLREYALTERRRVGRNEEGAREEKRETQRQRERVSEREKGEEEGENEEEEAVCYSLYCLLSYL